MTAYHVSAGSACLVTGASGVLGRALVAELLRQGYRVKVLVLENEKAEFAREVEAVSGDLRKAASLLAATKGVECVFHLAGLTEVTGGVDIEAFRAVNVTGTRNLLKAAAASNAKRIIFFSSIHVYGTTGRMVDENTPARPVSPYARSKLEAEREVVRVCDSSRNLEYVILRLSAVYGPEMKGNYPRMVRALNRRAFVPVGKGLNRRTMIYFKDVPTAALLAATEVEAAGQVFNVSDGSVYTIREIMDTMCRILNRPRPAFTIPERPALLAASLVDKAISRCGGEPTVSDKVRRFTEDVAISSRKISEQLGFHPTYSLEAGWSETIAAWRDRGFLQPG